jgi:hypothetical protein
MSAPVVVWRYTVPAEPEHRYSGWGYFLIDSSGMFTCVTDYGNYAYKWSDWGPRDFRRFLCGLSSDYLCGKLDSTRTYDGERTYKRVREEITSLRRSECITGEFAYREWRLAKQMVRHSSTDHDFRDWYEETELENASELAQYSLGIQVRTFAERLYPRLVELLKDDLEALPPPVTESTCRRCSECRGQEHHWLPSAADHLMRVGDDPASAELHIVVPCKHCDAIRKWKDDDND